MDLQLALIILGGFAITGILVHGLWTIRNNSQKQADWTSVKKAIDGQQRQPAESGSDGFDQDGIGQVRVVNRQDSDDEADTDAEEASQEPTTAFEGFEEPEMTSGFETSSITPPEHKEGTQDKVDQRPPEEPDPMMSDPEAPDNGNNAPKWTNSENHYPEPPSSLLKPDSDVPTSNKAKVEPSIQQSEFLEETPTSSGRKEPVFGDAEPLAATPDQPEEKKASLAEQAKNLVKREKPLKKIRRTEPKVAEDQMRIDFDDQPKVDAESVEKTPESNEEQQQEVLVLNVKMEDGKTISGSALLPMLLTLGFKFGDQDIFHRHVNSNGKGPVLFSLANMFRPGVFDIDNMENFTTQGVSLFMVLPIEGDPRQVFNMMHNATRKLADEFGAQMLDGRRALLTKQALQQYMDKIRESERLRMLRKH